MLTINVYRNFDRNGNVVNYSIKLYDTEAENSVLWTVAIQDDAVRCKNDLMVLFPNLVSLG